MDTDRRSLTRGAYSESDLRRVAEHEVAHALDRAGHVSGLDSLKPSVCALGPQRVVARGLLSLRLLYDLGLNELVPELLERERITISLQDVDAIRNCKSAQMLLKHSAREDGGRGRVHPRVDLGGHAEEVVEDLLPRLLLDRSQVALLNVCAEPGEDLAQLIRLDGGLGCRVEDCSRLLCVDAPWRGEPEDGRGAASDLTGIDTRL